MADLSTTYMGIAVKSPIVVGACSISANLDRVRRVEELGAGALVIKSLFEEQIQLERQELDDALDVGLGHQEAEDFFPRIEHAGPEEHCFWVEKTRKAVKMPLIASLNAVAAGTWVEWTRRLAETGVDGIELNVFTLGGRPDTSGADVEARLIETVAAVKDQVKIPVSVKLGPYFSSLGHVAKQLDATGVAAIVLFNRFFRPEIDIRREKLVNRLQLSAADERPSPLRWIALLNDRVKADLIAATGIHEADSAIKMLLAGAQAVQVVSTLLTGGLGKLAALNEGLAGWMDEKGYENLDAFRGKLGHAQQADPYAFERAQYVKAILGFD